MGGDTAWDTVIGWFYSSCVRGAICNSPYAYRGGIGHERRCAQRHPALRHVRELT
jgi:hypothetical protein